MSGHSKWATIKHDKGINDAKRGKIFSKLSKAISIAVREGGGDNPEFNPKLRLMIEKAKASNMPKENVQRAIDKGAGRIEGMNYQEVTYEGFGPNKIAMMINCVTDNTNRTNSEIKSLFDKNGGVLGSQGSTAYFFDKKGLIRIAKTSCDEDTAFSIATEAGADDFQVLKDAYEIVTTLDTFENVKNAFEKNNIPAEYASLTYIPKSTVHVEGKDAAHVLALVEALEDLDDVQNVYANFDISDEDIDKFSEQQQ